MTRGEFWRGALACALIALAVILASCAHGYPTAPGLRFVCVPPDTSYSPAPDSARVIVGGYCQWRKAR